MAPHPSAQFVEAVLNCTGGQFELSYTDPDQKLQIIQDLLSLIQEFPNFALSMDTFTHNDGRVVNLICAIASLHVSNSNPPVLITSGFMRITLMLLPCCLWIHQGLDFDCPISCGHPYVDSSSGLIASPYIHSWDFLLSNLGDLVRNLVNFFSLDHPVGFGPSRFGFSHPTNTSKNEAINRLVSILHLDITLVRSKTAADVEGLLQLQLELAERAEAIARGFGKNLGQGTLFITGQC